MRPLVALLLILPLFSPGASAAEDPLFTDEAGDVVWEPQAADTPLPALSIPNDGAAASDLVSLSASETEESLLVTITTAGYGGDPTGNEIEIDLSWSGRDFMVLTGFFRSSNFGEFPAYGFLLQREGDSWDYVAELTATLDDGASSTTVEVPKVYLIGVDKRIPGRGDAVEFTAARANTGAFGFGFAGITFKDQMPDEGAGSALLTLTMGDYSQGTLILSSPDRVRVSNGGSTTFVYQLQVHNIGQVDDEYAIGLADLPPEWNATVQSPIRVAANSEKVASILVSVPFAHDHGGYSSFNVTAQSARDPASSARMRMGVLHTPIPQPAGHHSELYLHATGRDTGPFQTVADVVFPAGWGWMNTASDHSEDTPYVTPNYFGDDLSRWWIPLNPSLQLGLDFDLTRMGSLAASMTGPSGDVEIQANLYYYTDDAEIHLAEGEPVTVTLDPQTPAPFEIALTPLPESDYIAYQKGASMVLVVSVPARITDEFFFTPDPQEERIFVEDFLLTLPLNEYHDRLTGASEASQVVEIAARGPVEKTGLPGAVLTYTFDVRNGGAPDVFVVDAAGNDAQLAIIVPRGEIALATGESREVTVAMEIPFDANDGEEFEILLFVHARDDPSKMAIARTKTKATHAAADASPDESGELLAAQAREQQTPGLAPLALLAVLVGLALFRRR